MHLMQLETESDSVAAVKPELNLLHFVDQESQSVSVSTFAIHFFIGGYTVNGVQSGRSSKGRFNVSPLTNMKLLQMD